MLTFILGGWLCGILLYYVFFRIKINFQKLLMVILRVESERWLSVHLTWGSSPSQAEICLRLISRPGLGPSWPPVCHLNILAQREACLPGAWKLRENVHMSGFLPLLLVPCIRLLRAAEGGQPPVQAPLGSLPESDHKDLSAAECLWQATDWHTVSGEDTGSIKVQTEHHWPSFKVKSRPETHVPCHAWFTWRRHGPDFTLVSPSALDLRARTCIQCESLAKNPVSRPHE